MERKVKVGIIGCGGICNGKHMNALTKLDYVEIVALCDIIVERAYETREKFKLGDNVAVYEDYKELLKDESIEVVHVLTPNRSHSFITIDALEAGKIAVLPAYSSVENHIELGVLDGLTEIREFVRNL